MAGALIPFSDIEIKALPKRGLTVETCKRWGYGVAQDAKHGTVQVANYYDPLTREIVGQQLRTADKNFPIRGNITGILGGRHLWRDAGKRVIITEGYIDAMSVDQVLGYRWQVVTVPNGAGSARSTLTANLEWLNGFEEVVLCFDNDEAGQAAVTECVGLFAPGKVKIATLPLKDANAMLVEKQAEALVSELWGAKAYRPDGIVTIKDIRAEALEPPSMGLPWCWEGLNAALWGRHYGELVGIGAGTGIGKTTLTVQQITADLQAGHKVGAFLFEQPPSETAKLIAGMATGKQFAVPDGAWSPAELAEALDDKAMEGLYLYDHFGANDWNVVRETIRYLYHAHGVRLFYVDHLTALAAGSASEVSAALEVITREMGSIVKELPIWMCFVSHLNTPDGVSHEEGGRVTIKHFKGSRAIGFWAHFLFGLERNQQDDDEGERSFTQLRVLKARPPRACRATGRTFPLKYDFDTGRLEEGRSEEKAMFNNEEEEAF